jgi:molybdopterin-containing oxidoreductase family iron-sulfur binding subunit
MSPRLTRRSFLKVAAVAGATAAGCEGLPARELIPYVIPDEHTVPGVATFFATVCRECSAGCGVIARVREGRVIKLEGNPREPISGGALCARGQAALQGLYNPDRLDGPRGRTTDGKLEPISWEGAVRQVGERAHAAAAAGADRVAFIAPPVGPTLEHVVGSWLRACKSGRRLRYEPLDEPAARAASALCFGRTDLPLLHIDAADALLSLDADFLETWRSPVEYTRQYAAFRAPRPGPDGRATIGRAVYVGPRMGLTAANCDEWIGVAPGDEALIGGAVLQALVRRGIGRTSVPGDALREFADACSPSAVAQRTGVDADTIERIAATFASAQHPIFLAGTAEPSAHHVAAVLNVVTGALGTTVRYLDGVRSPAPSLPSDVRELTAAMRRGDVDMVVVAGGNPVFSAAGFADALGQVPFVVWCGGVPDETAQHAHLLLPCHHTLESWTDATPRPGVTIFGQPVTQAVVDSRPLGDILLASARLDGGDASALPWTDMRAAVEASWRERHVRSRTTGSFEDFWQSVGSTGGVFEDAAVARVELRAEALQQPLRIAPPRHGLVCAAWPHPFLYDGRGADKPWLQEIPEPVAQLVWDSWVELHPATADQLGVADDDVVELRSAHGRISAPARRSVHVPPSVVAVPFGQGHTAYGRYGSGRGANPWDIVPLGKRAVAVSVRRTGARRALVSPLGSPDMLERPIAEAMTLATLRSGVTPPDSDAALPPLHEMRSPHVYPEHEWGMTIDLNACTGCSACVAACYAENNVPVVGREEVARGHIMSWIRIERFEPATADGPLLHLMPMLCQQCDRAPCESVCPVFASVHTDEGLNAQVYNRCIGTRYCNNNCPYKVRRFNWFDHPWAAPLHLQLNPDVTVRGAGVMEKCTFCVQRIRSAEMDAHAAGESLRDGDITPACAQACPARAITFGDMKDDGSAVLRRRAENPQRGYRALESLNTRPAIVYLRDVHRRREGT